MVRMVSKTYDFMMERATYLGRYIIPSFPCHRVFQSDRRCIDKITLALGHPQMDPTICPRLDVKIAIPVFDFGVYL